MESIDIESAMTVAHDPNYIEYVVRIIEKDVIGDTKKFQTIDLHKCNDSDYNHFFEPQKGHEKTIEKLK